MKKTSADNPKSRFRTRMLVVKVFLCLLFGQICYTPAGAVPAEPESMLPIMNLILLQPPTPPGTNEEPDVTDKNAMLMMVPEWLRSYPGASYEVIYSTKSRGHIYVGFKFETRDSMEKVTGFFKQAMETSGSKVEIEESDGYSGPEMTLSNGLLSNPSIRIKIKRNSKDSPFANPNTQIDITYSHHSRVTGSEQGYAGSGPESADESLIRTMQLAILYYGLIALVMMGIGTLGTAFWIWMLVECLTKEADRGNEKIVWLIIILFAHVLGAALYYFIRRPVRIAALSGQEMGTHSSPGNNHRF